MKTWPIYLRLQTELAYGPSTGAPNPNAANEHKALAEYAARLFSKRASCGQASLIIGPGGIGEIEGLRHQIPNPIFAMTAHAPEVAAIKAALPGMQVDLGDIHDMPYSSGYFDFVHASNVLEHALSPYIALTECRRVLAPGGIGSFVMPSFEGKEGGVGPFHLHCLDQRVWAELLHKTGFDVADVFTQEGVDDSTARYFHYRCVAVTPPRPHDRILEELITCKAPKQ